jgi:glycosyltransferase involved in cell wall biosynthesis
LPVFGPRDLVVLLAGGFNTWLDVDTLFAGVEAAMARDEGIHLVAIGGGIPGHEEQRHVRFRRAVRVSPHADRCHLLDWIPTGQLAAVFRSAHLLLTMDLPCHEAELGSRTRILDALERGLPVAATDACELTRGLRPVREFHPLAVGDAGALTDLLLRLAANRRRGRPAVRPKRNTIPWADVRGAHTLETTTAPLVRWLENPRRAPSGAADLGAAHAAEAARLRQELHRIWRTPTWRTLGAVHRWAKRSWGGDEGAG